MKKIIALFLTALTLYGCGEDAVVNNNGGGNNDFDIYVNKLNVISLRGESYTVKKDGSNFNLFFDTLLVASSKNGLLGLAIFDSSGGFFSSIYTANSDGTNLIRIPTGNFKPMYFHIASTGNKILFTTQANRSLYVMNLDGSSVIEVSTNLTANSELLPLFSPSGNKIAFLEVQNGNMSNLIITNADGSDKKILKDSIFDTGGGRLDWSPDNTKLVYDNNIQNLANIKICTIDTSGNQYSELTSGRVPSWSPAGNKISFLRSSGFNEDLFIMDTDGLNIINISNTASLFEHNGVWSKDGERILYTTQLLGNLFNQLNYYDIGTNTTYIVADSVSSGIWKD